MKVIEKSPLSSIGQAFMRGKFVRRKVPVFAVSIGCMLSSCAFVGCTRNISQPSFIDQPSRKPVSVESTHRISVKIHGALREIMHMGRTERRIDLGPLIGQKGLFGLGALEGLGGEVTLWDGQLWLSKPDGRGGELSRNASTATEGATLLVTSTVEAWQERPITESVTFAELDGFIEREARAAGVNVNEAFPFRIEGLPERLDWHVIDGSKIPADAHGHEAHMRTAVRGTMSNQPARIIGFFSPKHHAVFTHHDTNTHAHVISETPMLTGHIDYVDVSPGSRLFLPIQ